MVPTQQASGRGGVSHPGPGAAPTHPDLVGVVDRIRSFTGPGGTPPGFHLAVADLTAPAVPLPWQSDRQAFGMSWADADEARRAAGGEAVERHCGSWPPPAEQLLHGSYHELARRGVAAVDPDSLTLYSPRQYAADGFPFRPFDRDTPVAWVPGRSAGRDRAVRIPAFLVHTFWARMPKPHPEPLIAFPAIGGIAAGPTLEQALLAGLEEVIERDAVAVWWANAAPPPALPLTERIHRLLAPALDRYEIALSLVGNGFGVPVLAASVRSRAESWLTMGFAARADPEQAALKALAEAFGLQLTARALDDPAAVDRMVRGCADRRSPLRPWRQDRGYLDSYRADCADVVELLCQQQLYLDPRAGDRALAWTGRGPETAWAQLPRLPERSFDVLRGRVEAAGFEVLYADLTRPPAAAAGMHAVRVVVPGLVGTAPAAYPYLGLDRVRAQATALGWRDAPLPEEALNTFPAPHS